jgi:hypothetical protein
VAAADELDGQADELDGQADELDGQESGEQVPADHRPRPDAYPAELGQLLCDVCETLCSPGRPCHCCWVEKLCQEDGDG